ncbi:DUF1642 domain-containing protein [Streptococcus sp. NM]|uniref:DUF1642 domain-containing protein n=1 Tax=unclassified Streptococcus TaxID=2608887 RepID=UPI0008A57797|nr:MULTISPECIES: DUF1642 domain-containing protein [unclassified Streptococcus]OFO01488.1 hypothetical protein HMPREF2613_00860 [Streptococcus sp. HMSC070B10]REK93580.1 DUF1642 domain-containing protein [Streptococcus sp. NM]
MKLNELVEKYKKLEGVWNTEGAELARQIFLQDLEQLDEPETGHADEAPRYVKNILARLRELPVHDREVWLKAIMGEFEKDFSHAKWREGYEQGKLEGEWVGNQLKDADKIRRELNQVKVPQFVADVIEGAREQSPELEDALHYTWGNGTKEFTEWYNKKSNRDLFARAWLDGYIVEKEKKYEIKLLNQNDGDLYLVNQNANLADKYGHFSPVVLLFTKSTFFSEKCYKLTKKEVVSNGFGWIFDCEGVEVQEVE